MVGDGVGRRRQIRRPRAAAIACGLDERRQQALTATQIENAAATREKPVQDDVCERSLARELAEREVIRERPACLYRAAASFASAR